MMNRFITSATCLLALIALLPSAQGQTVGGVKPGLPVLPPLQPRPAEGTGANEQWQSGVGQEPTASFIDSLKQNDAAVAVVVGQGRLLTTKKPIATKEGTGVIAVGDPSILDFQVMPNPNMIRLVGLRSGVTDISITLADGETYSLEVHVTYDLELLRAYVRQSFPDAYLKLAQIREHLVVEGQARNPQQVAQILKFLEAYLGSVQVKQQITGNRSNNRDEDEGSRGGESGNEDGEAGADGDGPQRAGNERGGDPRVKVTFNRPQIVNLIRVPGSQQVMLKVRIAELNRTALREVGADIGFADESGNIIGTKIGGATVDAVSLLGLGGVRGLASSATSNTTTAFGIFPGSDFEVMLRLLRQNSLLRVLAEPNLIALSGHRANFLAGGEFPVPVPQAVGGFGTTTVEFREFGVRLEFVPYVRGDNTIRLSVVPEVSNIDFTLGTTLVVGGDPVPGLNTRRAATTVELQEGQTLAIAGLLQLEIAGNTGRIPGLGDMPYLGPFFSNTSHRSVEKELLVLVSPHLIEPIGRNESVPYPGECIQEPNDKEFYFLNRIEGRTGRPHRSTVEYEPIMKKILQKDFEQSYIQGPCGYSR